MSGRGVGKALGISHPNVMNWIKKAADVEKLKICAEHFDTVELNELFCFLERKGKTKTRENLYIMTRVSRNPRQIVGHLVSLDKSAETIQKMADKAPEARVYCMDGYSAYWDMVFSEKHIFNPHNKNDTFTVEGVNADLRHYILPLPEGADVS